MIPAAFDYRSPASLEEALSLLREHGPDAKVLAGGQSLIPLMRFRLAEPGVIVDLRRCGELTRLEETDEHLVIGSMVRHATIETTGWLRERYPLLADAADVIADPLVRNRGTVGGSLVHADPAGDWGAVMLACRAQLLVRGPGGDRTLPVDGFFLGPFTPALEPEEILAETRLPKAGPGEGGAYEKLERKVGDFATVGVAARVTLDEEGLCTGAGIGLTAVGPTNLRAPSAEEALVGGPPDEERITEASAAAAEDADPVADNRGSEEYKRDMVRVLTARALRRAVERAGGGE
ncbi:MAG: FAD binding domain-containing protein [Gemmatimonadota bacterium]